MPVYQDESLVRRGYTDSDFQSDIEFRKSTLDMCSPLEVEPSVRGVLSNLALLTLLWRLSTLQLQKQ